jgi:hypothetical protein
MSLDRTRHTTVDDKVLRLIQRHPESSGIKDMFANYTTCRQSRKWAHTVAGISKVLSKVDMAGTLCALREEDAEPTW